MQNDGDKVMMIIVSKQIKHHGFNMCGRPE